MNTKSTLFSFITSTTLICLGCHAQTPQEPDVLQDNNTTVKTAYSIHTGKTLADSDDKQQSLQKIDSGFNGVTTNLSKHLEDKSSVASQNTDYPKYDALLINKLATAKQPETIAVIVIPSQVLTPEQEQSLEKQLKNVTKQSNGWYAYATVDTLQVLAKSPLIDRISLQPQVSIPSPELPVEDSHQQKIEQAESGKKLLINTQVIKQSLDLLNQLNQHAATQNIAFSTYSIDQVAKAALLATPNPLTADKPSWLLPNLNPQSLTQPSTQLSNSYRIYNQLFYRQKDKVNPTFLQSYTQQLKGQTKALDFDKPQAASQQANAIINKQTQGLLDNIFTADNFSQSDAVLSNVLYFKANWLDPFDSAKTQDLPFTTASGKKQQVATMVKEFEAFTATVDGWQYVNIPFSDDSMLQLFITPEGHLTSLPSADVIAKLMAASQQEKIVLQLPKLNLQGSQISLNKVAPQLDAWQLTGLIQDTVLKHPKMLHNVVINWDETGAKAAAATSMFVSKSLDLTPPVKVDRPFVFMIRQGDEVMFTGAVRAVKE